ncbi:hypothetical protein [Rufibacter roseus]|uniref:DUF4890 domain-containing protein n=1 Tax=Rufibacter roseus TaxID=1567108 RepID=A0ABW2DPV3_9BACT|nr:hypothetical protein [Rufibacter roseus]
MKNNYFKRQNIMKKLILSAFLFSAFYTAQAQTELTGAAAASRANLATMSATEMTRQMYNDLELNEGQYIKLKALNQSRIDRYNEIQRMYSNDTQMRDAKMREVNEQIDKEYAQILTPKQFTAYLENEGRLPEGAAGSSETNRSSTNASAGSAESEIIMEKGNSSQDSMRVKDDKRKQKSKKNNKH